MWDIQCQEIPIVAILFRWLNLSAYKNPIEILSVIILGLIGNYTKVQ